MKKQTKVMWNVGLIGGLLLLLFVLEQILPSSSMLFTVLKKGAIYALVAVSMNLDVYKRQGNVTPLQGLREDHQ